MLGEHRGPASVGKADVPDPTSPCLCSLDSHLRDLKPRFPVWGGAMGPRPLLLPILDPTWDPPGSPQLRSLCPGRGQLWHKEGPRDTSEVKGTEGDFSQTVIRVVSTLWDAGRGYSWSRRVVLGHHRQVLLPGSGPCPAP